VHVFDGCELAETFPSTSGLLRCMVQSLTTSMEQGVGDGSPPCCLSWTVSSVTYILPFSDIWTGSAGYWLA